MKTAWNVFSILLLINVLVLICLVAKLYADGRINQERVGATVEIFRTTIEEEQRELERQEQAQTLALEEEKFQTWLQQVKSGAVTVEDKIKADLQARESMEQFVVRLRSDRNALLDVMKNYKGRVELLQDRLKEQQQQFEQQVQERARQQQSEGFQQAVQLYERTKPQQVKKMFMDLIGRSTSGRGQVVAYLAAMQPRKAAGVIREFKSDREITVATQLIEQLRTRGIDLRVDQSENMGASI